MNKEQKRNEFLKKLKEVNNLMNWNKILNALGMNNIDEVYKNLKKF
jgi:hypothetical protein